MGTADYINKIDVKRISEAQFLITVDCKRHLNYPPIVECISYNLYTAETVRTNGHGWAIRLQATVIMNEQDVANPSFRLEILH